MQSKTSLGQVFGFMKTKQYVEAENLLNRLIRKEPKNHLWHELLGLLYVTLNDGVRGKSALEQALSLNPGSHLAWNNYGNAWALVKNTTQALKAYHQALVIAPNHSDAHFNAGRMHLMLAEFDQALKHLGQALLMDPQNPLYLSEMGNFHQRTDDHEAAISYFKKALETDPRHLVALQNMANSLVILGRYKEAATVLHEMNHLGLCSPLSVGLEMHCYTQTANWPEVTKCLDWIQASRTLENFNAHPFHLLSLTDDPDFLRFATRAWFSAMLPTHEQKETHQSSSHGAKRVGIISPDFRNHPVGVLIKKLIQDMVSSDKYVFFLLSLKRGVDDPVYDEYTKVQGFIDLSALSVNALIQEIQALDLDVLLDAGGLTQNMPIDIYGAALSRKVVNYLGYPAPLGSTTHDFIMMAPYCVGHDTLAEEDEKPLLMNCMPLPRDPGLTPSDKVFSKEELGIDPDAFVFGSFCHVHKLTQEVFHGWLQVLQRREKSVLYLGGVSDVAKPVLKTVAEQHGVNSNRIIYAHRIEDHRDHLARLRVIDLFLDTYPYGGHTTVSDAISAAVPVVTRSGKVMQSRIAAAQLAYIGLNRCIVHNMQEYINETVRLSQSPAELEEIRKVMASINYHDEAKIYLNAFIQAIDSVI